MVAAPVAAVILIASLLGSFVGFFILILYVLATFLASVYAAVTAGSLLSKWIRKTVIVDWKWVVFGAVALLILTLVPIVGWLITCAIFLAAFGTLVSFEKDKVGGSR